MKSYLTHTTDWNNDDITSVLDELPLWSAPFGIKLLEKVTLKKNITVLDIGSGTGFPAIELAARLGAGSSVTALDVNTDMLKRMQYKLDTHGIKNVTPLSASAEEIPFADSHFDLLTSNNGITNVNDINKALAECVRVCKPGGEFIITYNTHQTMHEFYSAFETVLAASNMHDAIAKMKEHIRAKRKPLNEMTAMLNKAGFRVVETDEEKFGYSFVNAEAMFSHIMIKNWFLPPWKELVPQEKRESVFGETEKEMERNKKQECITLTIPFVVLKLVRE